ncbi:hypothetical protein OC846_000473 [Tilletia horrida]|uniref:Alpha/beta hydrolase fold-3 domain-containing protein n=1 Tax=Tilletia horrida TaxID=155126 RepID=A0AAN6GUG2_9BASI|nr:hypothetical protein OC846_000473 [Tilletia horrida]KAK0567898.1 hypothetical protein OC861_002458 [Tilletia horrida]
MSADHSQQPHHPSLGSAAIEQAQAQLSQAQAQTDRNQDEEEQVQETEEQQQEQHQPKTTARWRLRLEAAMWRVLMEVGMVLHRVAPPTPPYPASRIRIPSTVSTSQGQIGLCIYRPEPSTLSPRSPADRLPCIVNFHGGGFTIGKATDDARWAAAVLNQVPAVLVSVDYRLAPAHPFPTAVQDGVDALLYLHAHADELGIDNTKFALSGFSAGGNLVFTVPLLLNELQRIQAAHDQGRERTPAAHNQGATLDLPPTTLKPSPTKHNHHPDGGKSNPPHYQEPDHINPAGAAAYLPPIPQSLRPVALIASYPSLDFSVSRADRRATNTKPDREMPEFFHNLFDASYLFPLRGIDMRSSFLSPAQASDRALVDALPKQIAIYAAEWDGLSQEAMVFAKRLQGLGKSVSARVLEGTTHAWDRSPNPLWLHKLLDAGYRDACKFARDVFNITEPPPSAIVNGDADASKAENNKSNGPASSPSKGGKEQGADAYQSPLSNRTKEKLPALNTEPSGTEAEQRTMASSALHLASGGDLTDSGRSAALSTPASEKARSEGTGLQGLPLPPSTSSASERREGDEEDAASRADVPSEKAVSAPARQQQMPPDEGSSSSASKNLFSRAKKVLSHSSADDRLEDDDKDADKSPSLRPRSILQPVAKVLSVPGALGGKKDEDEEEHPFQGAEAGTVVGPGKVVATKAEKGEAMVLELVDEAVEPGEQADEPSTAQRQGTNPT